VDVDVDVDADVDMYAAVDVGESAEAGVRLEKRPVALELAGLVAVAVWRKPGDRAEVVDRDPPNNNANEGKVRRSDDSASPEEDRTTEPISLCLWAIPSNSTRKPA
jgi:hypothetical protein